jgi:hypothetical protein
VGIVGVGVMGFAMATNLDGSKNLVDRQHF